jgi:predicted CXXCH cytochrome family protein
VESVSKVCGTCHALNADLFSASPHKKAFDARKLPECETCHGNHEIIAATDKLLGVSSDAVCSRCHHPNDNEKGYAAAKSMRSLIDSLEGQERLAGAIVDDAEQKGMEVSEAKFKLRDARQARLQSRTAVHAFNQQQFADVVGKGLAVTATVKEEGKQAVDEYYFRRWGLVIATLILALVGVSLYVIIKQIERKQQRAGGVS